LLHALELAREDLERWCGDLSDDELHACPADLPPVAFHLKHIARSLDRLLTYAEGRQLGEEQLNALDTELQSDGSKSEIFKQLDFALDMSERRVRSLDPAKLGELRGVGRKNLPSSVGGLLVHIADHTQRHVGQAITTAKVVMAARSRPSP
jgi:uncharacterized damage-inducible protein DinB